MGLAYAMTTGTDSSNPVFQLLDATEFVGSEPPAWFSAVCGGPTLSAPDLASAGKEVFASSSTALLPNATVLQIADQLGSPAGINGSCAIACMPMSSSSSSSTAAAATTLQLLQPITAAMASGCFVGSGTGAVTSAAAAAAAAAAHVMGEAAAAAEPLAAEGFAGAMPWQVSAPTSAPTAALQLSCDGTAAAAAAAAAAANNAGGVSDSSSVMLWPAEKRARTVFFARVPPAVPQQELEVLFQVAAPLVEMHLFKAYAKCKVSKGCGVAVYASVEEADATISRLNGRHIWAQARRAMLVAKVETPATLAAARARKQGRAAAYTGMAAVQSMGPGGWEGPQGHGWQVLGPAQPAVGVEGPAMVAAPGMLQGQPGGAVWYTPANLQGPAGNPQQPHLAAAGPLMQLGVSAAGVMAVPVSGASHWVPAAPGLGGNYQMIQVAGQQPPAAAGGMVPISLLQQPQVSAGPAMVITMVPGQLQAAAAGGGGWPGGLHAQQVMPHGQQQQLLNNGVVNIAGGIPMGAINMHANAPLQSMQLAPAAAGHLVHQLVGAPGTSPLQLTQQLGQLTLQLPAGSYPLDQQQVLAPGPNLAGY